MADERTYGFNRDDATELINSIGSQETWYPEIKPRGGGGQIELCHGLIIEQCNSACSTYRVQRVHRYLRPVCDDDGSGSGSGSGSGV
jgi:hypothetical protein